MSQLPGPNPNWWHSRMFMDSESKTNIKTLIFHISHDFNLSESKNHQSGNPHKSAMSSSTGPSIFRTGFK